MIFDVFLPRSTSSGNSSVYLVSGLGIAVMFQRQRPFSRIFQSDQIMFHKNDQKYPEFQENGSAESTREFVSDTISFL